MRRDALAALKQYLKWHGHADCGEFSVRFGMLHARHGEVAQAIVRLQESRETADRIRTTIAARGWAYLAAEDLTEGVEGFRGSRSGARFQERHCVCRPWPTPHGKGSRNSRWLMPGPPWSTARTKPTPCFYWNVAHIYARIARRRAENVPWTTRFL